MENRKFKVIKYKSYGKRWIISIAIQHNGSGTYLLISLIKWNIAIGFIKGE